MVQGYHYRPVLYFTVTFIVSFAFEFFGAYLSLSNWGNGAYMIFLLLGLMTPFMVSLGMILFSGSAGVRKDFLNRLVNIKLFRPKILPVFIFIMPLSVVVSLFISLLFGGSIEQLQFSEGFSFSTGFVPVLLLLLLAAAFEELGWRGYAFDSLQSRFSLFTATILFSVLWSFWHFPLMFVQGSYQWEVFQENVWFGMNFFVSIIPMGFIITWICLKNRKSVIAAILFHFIVNMSQEMFQITQVTKSIQTFVLTLAAAVIVYHDRELFFTRKNPVPERAE